MKKIAIILSLIVVSLTVLISISQARQMRAPAGIARVSRYNAAADTADEIDDPLAPETDRLFNALDRLTKN